GSGTLTVSGPNANTYASPTRVTDGTLQLNKTASSGSIVGDLIVGDDVGSAASAVVRLLLHSQIADASAVTVNSDGLFEVADATDGDVIGSLTVNRGSVHLRGPTGGLELGGMLSLSGGVITADVGSTLALDGDVLATSDAGGNPAIITGAGVV